MMAKRRRLYQRSRPKEFHPRRHRHGAEPPPGWIPKAGEIIRLPVGSGMGGYWGRVLWCDGEVVKVLTRFRRSLKFKEQMHLLIHCCPAPTHRGDI